MFRRLFLLFDDQKHLLYKTALLKTLEVMFLGSGFGFTYLIIRDLLAGELCQQSGIRYVLGFLCCVVLAYITSNIHKYRVLNREFLVLAKERTRLADHIKKLPMGFFNERSAGELSDILTESIKSIEPLSTIFGKLVGIMALVGMFLLAGITLNWQMTVAMFAGMPLALYLLFRDLGVTERELLKRQEIQGQVSEAAVEFASGIKEIKAFGKSAASLKKYQQAILDFKRQNLRLVRRLVFATASYQLAANIGIIPVMALGSYLVIVKGELTLPLYLLFLMITLRLYIPLQELAADTQVAKNSSAALIRVNGVYQSKSLPETAQERKIEHYDIEFKKVSFAYEDELVLKDISFYVPQNTTTALMGPSGSGKTTITSLIARFWDVNEGEVRIGGINVKDVKVQELLSHISMVFQDVYLFNDTILNNIKMGNQKATEEEVIAAARKANCHEFIMEFPDKYATVVGEGGGKLSGGEKQRISIARAFLKDAPIILLDEATANIDPDNELIIQMAINKLVKGKTAIIIAHKLSTIMTAHQVLVLDKGQIVQRGTHAELSSASGGIYNDYRIRRQKARGWKIAN